MGAGNIVDRLLPRRGVFHGQAKMRIWSDYVEEWTEDTQKKFCSVVGIVACKKYSELCEYSKSCI